MHDEYHLEFINECREHLASIEADLLAIEEGGEQLDDELVNKVFRAAHSIKGGSSFFGWNDIKELAHKAETVLDLIRARRIAPNAEVINVLLAAFDRLRELIVSPDPGAGGDVAELQTALTRLAASYLPAGEKDSLERQVELPAADRPHAISVAQVDLDRAARAGQCLYVVDYDLLGDVDRRGLNLLQVFRELAEFGEILDCLVDFDAVGTLDAESGARMPLRLVLASSLAPELMPEILGVSAEQIHLLVDPCKPGVMAEVPPPPVVPPSPAAEPAPPGLSPGESFAPSAASAPTPLPVPPAAPVGAGISPAPSPAPCPSPVVAPPAPSAGRPAPGAAPAGPPAPSASAGAEESLRVNVSVLEALVNLTGELVLGRNQLRSAIARKDPQALAQADQRLNQITTDIQEAVMRTRLQPIGNVFGKFPRVVRDLAASLGKEVELDIRGREVALDRTIVEGLSDPLTHMVRNAVDHGIETAAERRQAGKRPGGTVRIEARHEAGQVVVEIADDGRGIDPDRIVRSAVRKGLITAEHAAALADAEKRMLVFLPGLSTAEKVTDLSGRGVGMDVVKTNLDRLGGKVEIQSQPGEGSLFRIKLPLTLAILPALIVSLGRERFALPQTNVEELLRLPPGERAGRLDTVGGIEVLQLRGRVIPVVRLARLLDLDACAADSADAPTEIVVINTGTQVFALVVGAFHDTEEIVVKPLGRHLKGMAEYAGATILGDGRVALILDAGGVAARAGLPAGGGEPAAAADGAVDESRALLLFHNAPEELCAVALQAVVRIERIAAHRIEHLGGRRTMQYRGAALPLIALQDVAGVGALALEGELAVIVARVGGRGIGVLGALPVDVLGTAPGAVDATHRRTGIAGSVIARDRTTLVLDLEELVAAALPEFGAPPADPPLAGSAVEPPAGLLAPPAAGGGDCVVLAEDSDFFRAQVRSFLEAEGYAVLDAPDGEAAWEILQARATEVRLLVTDIEMPRLDGLGLARRVRSDERCAALPILAMSSLAGDEDLARSRAAGINVHLIKLDRDQLAAEVRTLLTTPVVAA